MRESGDNLTADDLASRLFAVPLHLGGLGLLTPIGACRIDWLIERLECNLRKAV